jgi:hypothetical protein
LLTNLSNQATGCSRICLNFYHTVPLVSGRWNSSTVKLVTSGQSAGQQPLHANSQTKESATSDLDKLLKAYLFSNKKNSSLVQNIMKIPELDLSTASTNLKECISRSHQDQLMLSSLLKPDADNARMTRTPEFNQLDVEAFGPRAAFQAQLRVPWLNPSSRRRQEAEVISQRAAFS